MMSKLMTKETEHGEVMVTYSYSLIGLIGDLHSLITGTREENSVKRILLEVRTLRYRLNTWQVNNYSVGVIYDELLKAMGKDTLKEIKPWLARMEINEDE